MTASSVRESSAPAAGPGADARPGLANRPGQNLEQLRERLKAADANGDGKLSKDEMPERLAPFFDRIDTDSDGQIDGPELRRGLEKMRDMAAANDTPGAKKPAAKKAGAKKTAAEKAKLKRPRRPRAQKRPRKRRQARRHRTKNGKGQ